MNNPASDHSWKSALRKYYPVFSAMGCLLLFALILIGIPLCSDIMSDRDLKELGNKICLAEKSHFEKHGRYSTSIEDLLVLDPEIDRYPDVGFSIIHASSSGYMINLWSEGTKNLGKEKTLWLTQDRMWFEEDSVSFNP